MNPIQIDRKFLRKNGREVSRNDIVFISILTLFLFILAIWSFFAFGSAGIVLAFFIGLPVLPFFLIIRQKYKELNKTVLELFEDHCTIYQEGDIFSCNYRELNSIIFKDTQLSLHLKNNTTIIIQDADALRCNLHKLIYVIEQKKDTNTPLHELFEKAPYIPNKHSFQNRFFALFFGLQIVALCVYGIYKGELYLPAKRGDVMTLTGISFYLGLLSAFLGIISLVLYFRDHYDTQDNEAFYTRWINISLYGAYSLFFLALLLRLILRQ